MEFALPHRTDVEKWTVEQVSAWLKDRNMPEAADVFLRRGIDGFQMLNLKEEMIIVWGRELRLRLRIDVMKLINQLRSLPSPSQRSKKIKQQKLVKTDVNGRPSQHPPPLPKTNPKTQITAGKPCEESSLDEAAYLVPLSCKNSLLTKHTSTFQRNVFPKKTPQISKPSNSALREPIITDIAKKTTIYDTNKSKTPPQLPTVGPPVNKLKQPIAHTISQTQPTNCKPLVQNKFVPSPNLNNGQPQSPYKSPLGINEKEKTRSVCPEFLSLGDSKKVRMTPLYLSLLNKYFFHPITRSAATKLLNKHGAFVIRPSTHTDNPLTLSIFIHGEMSHISIRQRKDGQFALGTPKPDEKGFKSVEDLVEYHRTYYIQKDTGETALLLDTPPKKR